MREPSSPTPRQKYEDFKRASDRWKAELEEALREFERLVGDDVALRACEVRVKVYREALEEIVEWTVESVGVAADVARDALKEGDEAAARELRRG